MRKKVTMTFFVNVDDKRDLFLLAQSKGVSASYILQGLISSCIRESGIRKGIKLETPPLKEENNLVRDWEERMAKKADGLL